MFEIAATVICAGISGTTLYTAVQLRALWPCAVAIPFVIMLVCYAVLAARRGAEYRRYRAAYRASEREH
jgi:hypothetical protein